MKHILVPIRVFESGDRVYTSDGLAGVLHDEMEGFEWTLFTDEGEAQQNVLMRQAVFVRLDFATSRYDTDEDVIVDRDHLILLDIYKERPKTCPHCGGTDFEDESTAQFAQRLWRCTAPRPAGQMRGCGEMFLVDPNKGV
jgi:hypothetical protein